MGKKLTEFEVSSGFERYKAALSLTEYAKEITDLVALQKRGMISLGRKSGAQPQKLKPYEGK